MLRTLVTGLLALLLWIVWLQPVRAQQLKFSNEYMLWPNGAPGSNPASYPHPNYREEWRRNDETVIFVTHPTIRVFRPAADKNTGAAVIVCPGGGYNILEIDHEGYRVAGKLNEMGITVVVLKYRHYDRYAALQDAHRAIRFVRSKAREWGITENRIGIGGFSAGGHLSLHAATNLAQKEEWAKDAVDALGKKPDFLMLIYPGFTLPQEAKIDQKLPPVFMALSADDEYELAEPASLFYYKLQILKVPSEMHIFQQGGHGYGLGREGCQCRSWPTLFRNWLQANRFITL
jgi:predicted esterase